MDIASLSIEINTSDVAKAEADLDSFGATGKKSEESARGIGSAWKAALGSVAADLKTAVGELQALNARQEATARAVAGLGATFDGAAGSIRAAAEALSAQRVETAKVEAASLGAAKGVDTLGSVALQQSASVAQASAKLNGLTAAADGAKESSMSAAAGLTGLAPSATAAGAALGKAGAELDQLASHGAKAGEALDKDAEAMRYGKISAGEYNQAMRLLPMQISDVVSSLASGMPIWTVAIQQGAQITDSFGGVSNSLDILGNKISSLFSSGSSAAALGASLAEVAKESGNVAENASEAGNGLSDLAEEANTSADAAKNVKEAYSAVSASASTASFSMAAAVGTTLAMAAAIGTLFVAYRQGSDEADAYEQALILTGNAAGTSADRLASMAVAMDSAGTTQKKAAAALAEIAGTGKFAEGQIRAIAEASIAMEKAVGKSVSASVKEFAGLAESPAAASAKLNEQYHYLTASVYEQISALEDEGKQTEAAKVATDAYAAAMKTRSEQIDGNLGLLESAWRKMGKAASESWDAALDIGRTKTIEQQIERTQKLIDDRSTGWLAKLFPGTLGADSEDTKALKARLALLQQTAEANAKVDEAEGKRQAAASANIAASAEVKRLTDLIDKVKADGSYLAEANDWIKKNAAASDEQKRAVLGAAAALDAEKKAQEDAKKATNDATNAAKQQAEALSDFLEKSGVVTKSSDAMAKAYLAGAVGVRELSIQQEIENELLKTGESAREAVTKAVNEQRDAQDRLDVAKNIAGLRTETELTLEQAAATLGGAAALDAFNVKKAMQTALVGKNISVESEEYKLLLKQTQARLDANKALEQAARVNGVMDRLYPQQKLLRDYKDDQEALNKAIEQYPAKADEYRAALVRLSAEYEVNKNALTAWGKFTERQLDRVDQAFSDAWLNIGHGFDSFASGLKKAFSQMLAELAHMALTRPIVMQLGSALGVVSAEEAAANRGIWGSLFDGSGGQTSILSKLGSALSIGNIVSKVGGWLGIGSMTEATSSAASAAGSAATAAESAAGAATAAESTAAATAGIASGLSSALPPIAVALAAYQGFSSYMDGARPDPKGTRGNLLAWASFQPLAEINGAINKLTKLIGLDGTVIGGLLNIPGMALQGISNALFGSWKIKDYGIALGVNDGELNPQSYVYKKKKGLLTGTKKKTSYDPLTGDSAQQLQEAFATTEDGVASIFEQLGYAIDDGAYAGLQIARAKISTKGKTEEEVSKAVQDWFTQAGESINSYLNATLGTGLSYDIAGMTTFVNNLYAVNGILDHLNVGLFSTNVAGGKLVEELLGLTGGLDALTSSVSTYYDQFFSDTEKQANTLADVTKAFADANQTLPATRAEYRAMVESIDLTTEAGRSMFATLMNLAGQADSYYDIVEQRAADAAAAAAAAKQAWATGLTDQANSSFEALKRSIGAQQQSLTDAYNARIGSLNDMVGTANSAISSMASVGNSLDAALKQLLGTSDQATAVLHEQAVATLQSALAFAKAGGSLASFAGLQDALDSATSISAGNYSTREELQREQGRTANLIAQLQGANGAQLSTGQQILDSLQLQIDQAKTQYDGQMAALDAQLADGQSQLDALNGVDNSVLSVVDAIRAMNDSVVAALSALADGMAQSAPAQNNASLVDSVYQTVLGRAPDAGGAAYWQDRLQSGSLDYDQLAAAIASGAISNQTESTAGKSNASDYLGSAVAAAYQTVLGRTPDSGGAAYWLGQLQSGAVTGDQLQLAIRNGAIANGETPKFATGGAFTNSVVQRPTEFDMALMGEAGPEAILPLANVGGSLGVRAVIPGLDALQGPQLDVPTPLVLSRSRSAADIGSTASADEIRGLRADMAQVFDALRSIAKHTMQTAKRAEFLERWDYDGMPTVRA